MRMRIILGKFFVRWGRFIQSLAVMVMKSRDLVEYTRWTYARSGSIKSWGENQLVELGLFPEEKELYERMPIRTGSLLVLGVGGGRESLVFAGDGFEVTGLDFVPELVEKAKANAKERNLNFRGIVQDISRLELEAEKYDCIWLSYGLYSFIPTRMKRIDMLRRASRALKPDGFVICQFLYDPEPEFTPHIERMRRLFAYLSLGNLSYEKGDRLLRNIEYAHMFQTEESLRREFQEAEFIIDYIKIPESGRGGAILGKPA